MGCLRYIYMLDETNPLIKVMMAVVLAETEPGL